MKPSRISFSKSSGFLFIDKSQVEKSVDVISCLFCTAKKKKKKKKKIQKHPGS